tara:strand:- start:280 stop:432 length:153 start_codon:yes stop_codon:yes gene_type:complete
MVQKINKFIGKLKIYYPEWNIIKPAGAGAPKNVSGTYNAVYILPRALYMI